jgi:hypothetical protein
MTSLCACLPQAGLPYFARKKRVLARSLLTGGRLSFFESLKNILAKPAFCRQDGEPQKLLIFKHHSRKIKKEYALPIYLRICI